MGNLYLRWIGSTSGLESHRSLPRLDPAELSFFERLQTLVRRERVRLRRPVRRICGVDASYKGGRVYAVATLFERGHNTESSYCYGRVGFPYAPGLLYVREGPFATAAVDRLVTTPDLVCFDAHGTAHPRGAGMALTCGTVLGIPSIGIAKSMLTGTVKSYRESLQKITIGEVEAGFATHSPGGRRYWSPGYSVSLKDLEEIIRKYAGTCAASVTLADKMTRGAVWHQES